VITAINDWIYHSLITKNTVPLGRHKPDNRPKFTPHGTHNLIGFNAETKRWLIAMATTLKKTYWKLLYTATRRQYGIKSGTINKAGNLTY